jgi:hypothetical protein
MIGSIAIWTATALTPVERFNDVFALRLITSRTWMLVKTSAAAISERWRLN